MDAQKYLEQVKEKQEFWERKKLELYQLKCLETNTAAQIRSDPVQSSGDKDRMGSAITRRIVFEEKVVNKAENDFLSYRDECIEVLEQVMKIKFLHYKILHIHYIEYLPLTDVAEKAGYSYQYVKELHREGLKNVQKILDVSKVPT